MTMYELHRKFISGTIRPETPTCVIFEIGDSAGLVVDASKADDLSYVQRVADTATKVVSKTLTEEPYVAPLEHGFRQEDLTDIARFVNPNLTLHWKVSDLLRAFRHLLTFYKVKEPPLPAGSFVIGQKTSQTPLAYNACMLYRLCLYYAIRTSREMTLEQMGDAVRALLEDPEVIRQRLIAAIRSMPRTALISLSFTVDLRVSPSPNIKSSVALPLPKLDRSIKLSEVKSGSFTADNLDRAYQGLISPNCYIPRLHPISQEEAVVLAAIRFGINLCECSNPHEEFTALEQAAPGTYVPRDAKFAPRYLANPTWFDVRRTWEPLLRHIYKPDQLIQFAQAEGYQETDLKTRPTEELLHMSRIQPTFFLGRHPDAPQQSVIGREEVLNVQRDLCLSYGRVADAASGGISSRNATGDYKTQPFTLYTVTELAEAFEINRSYIDPIRPGETFLPVAIAKLRNIAREQLRSQRPRIRTFQGKTIPDETEIATAYRRILNAMDLAEQSLLATSEQARRLSEYYGRSDAKIREQMVTHFTNLLHIGYYMRGWKVGSQAPPITATQTLSNPADQWKIEKNVAEGLHAYNQSLGLLPTELRRMVIDLPLMHMKVSAEGRPSFVASIDRQKGLTIADRLQICQRGELNGNVNSCIRLSSNWFVSSAVYYLLACGRILPFNPKDFAVIS